MDGNLPLASLLKRMDKYCRISKHGMNESLLVYSYGSMDLLPKNSEIVVLIVRVKVDFQLKFSVYVLNFCKLEKFP